MFLITPLFLNAQQELPTTYTLVHDDYDFVRNGKYDNFDIRAGKKDSDPLVILKKLDLILKKSFNTVEQETITVTFNVYDDNTSTETWNLYVENLKFRTNDYVFNDGGGFSNLGTPSTLDIVTWNIEHFPKQVEAQNYVADFINKSDLDVFALQEIGNDEGGFNDLIANLGPDFGSYINHTDNWNQNLAIIYKKDEITLVTAGREITELENSSPFPRTPIEIVFKHKSGIEFVVINNHLKCCDGGEERRREASKLLKKYIDDTYKSNNTKIVLLGDLNDRIDSGESDNVFSNFIDDAANYMFVDMVLSESTKDGPGWPNIDHILINNAMYSLFDKDAKDLNMFNFEYNYEYYVSDHYPVWVNLNPETLGNDINYIYKSTLKISPNPSSKNSIILSVAVGKLSGVVEFYNMQGKLVLSEKLINNSVDISKLAKGTYIISVNKNDEIYTQKFIRN